MLRARLVVGISGSSAPQIGLTSPRRVHARILPNIAGEKLEAPGTEPRAFRRLGQ